MDDVSRFADVYQRFMERMSQAAWTGGGTQIQEAVHEHLGVDPSDVPVVSDTFEAWDHVNVHVALMAYLQGEGRSHELIGISGQQRHFESISDLIRSPYGVQIGSVNFVNLPVGPDETLACVQFGMFFIRDRDVPLVVLMRGQSEFGPQQAASLEVLSPDQKRAEALLGEVRTLMNEHNVFRGQVISFGESRMGYEGVGPIIFLRRPAVDREDVILPDRVLDLVDRQVLGVARFRDRLRTSGQHVKRGLLLYGPPGNGKTLTVRYLLSRARDHTVLVLTGGALHLLRPACGLARMLQPAMIVLEDVDLVAQERGMFEGGASPVLFDLLNQMDGVADDADVVFLLTTNRVDVLEPALAARPGRVDLALEIQLPDADARRRLLSLYGRGLDLPAAALDMVVDRTEGVAASFIKELLRKAAILAAERNDESGALRVNEEDLSGALDELLDERSALTRSLLGGDSERAAQRAGTEWLLAGGGTDVPEE